MPRKPCYWTRKLELELVKFVRDRDFIWKPVGNTNHQIKQKYKAYAEFAAKLGPGFTARSVRDRWVNIRSTFRHNARRVHKSQLTARAASDIYTPCWPLWQPLQFLAAENDEQDYSQSELNYHSIQVKEELTEANQTNTLPNTNNVSEESLDSFPIRQRGQRTNRPRRKQMLVKSNRSKCKRIVEDLVKAMEPMVTHKDSTNGLGSLTEFIMEPSVITNSNVSSNRYWFFSKHVTEQLNSMRDVDAKCASHDIMKFLEEFS